ncbi:hypothetical protein [Arthrobacter sp. Ld5]|uniref:hypothetical protein n=1 Tax=Arthrobacter sp. Ld5 TaxID=649152 RepID=UPI003EBE71BB
MDDNIQLISDDDGLAIIGDASTVERFLVGEGFSSRELGIRQLKSTAFGAAAVAQAGSEVSANSGRWVKLTEESAQLVKKYGLMKNSETGLSMGVVVAKGETSGIKGIVQFAKGPGSLMTSPALLSGVAGIMTQAAMQQTMDDITDYLATIDEKVDDLLRAQKDTVLADVIGVDFIIEEAMTIREQVGLVSETTWSKVQASSATIARTQGYALRQLDALAEKMDRKAKVGDLAKASRDAEATIHEWLAVLARCFQLQDAIAVLELDRVLEASPSELDRHRVALQAARQNRLNLIARSTQRLLNRIDAAAGWANSKVLLHPASSRAVIHTSNQLAAGVGDFHERLGIEGDRQPLAAKRWMEAVVDVKDRVVETGVDGVGAARSFGDGALDRAKLSKDRLSNGVRAFREAVKDEQRVEEG